MRQSFGIICTLLTALLLSTPQIHASNRLSLQYLEARGETVQTRRFLVEPNGKGVAIQSSIRDNWFFTECDFSGNTRQWHVNKAESDFRAVRDGNIITISGRFSGQSVNKTLEKDELPWFQSLYYSLGRFVQSDKEEIEFWMIRPDNLSLVKLHAQKETVEMIRINGHEEETQKVRLNATGLLSFIWYGYYWYTPKDGVMVKYKDMKALPGRSKLTMHLSQAEKS